MSQPASVAAAWMKERLDRDGCLFQDEAASEIQIRFGEEHVYVNDAGNLAISRVVLAAFRRLTDGYAVWSFGDRQWRLRIETDGAGRRTE